MNNTHYVVEVKSDYGMLGVHEIGYVFDTLKEVEEKIKIVQEQKSTSSIKVIEYRLVYDHKNYLPKPDGFNQFFKENVALDERSELEGTDYALKFNATFGKPSKLNFVVN